MFWKITKIGHKAWAGAFGKCSVWVKNWNSRKAVENDSRSTLELFWPETGLKKAPNIQTMTTFRNHQNWSQGVKNDSRSTLEFFCAKDGFKKLLTFEKWQVFENRRNLSQSMAYSPCKMLSLGQKLKF